MQIETPSNDTVLIDLQDWAFVRGWNVNVVKRRRNKYAQLCKWDNRRKKQIKLSLHREILRAPPGVMVCHKNGNGLDCRRSNLVLGNHTINGSSIRHKRAGSASTYRGVHINRGRGKRWSVQFWDHGKCVYLGRFDSEIAAAKRYDQEAKRRFGEMAHLNFP